MSSDESPLNVPPVRRKLSRRLLRAFLFFVVLPVAGLILLADSITWREASRSSADELRRVARSYGHSIVKELEAAERALRAELDGASGLDESVNLSSGEVFESVEIHEVDGLASGGGTSVVRRAVSSVGDGESQLKINHEGAPVFICRAGTTVVVGTLRSAVLREQVVRSALIFKSKFTLFGSNGELVVDTFDQPIKRGDMQHPLFGDGGALYQVEGAGGNLYVGVEELIELPFGSVPDVWTARLMVDDDLFMATAKTYRRMTLSLAGLIFAVVVFMGTIMIRLYLVHLDTLLAATSTIASRKFSHRVNIHTNDEFEALGDAFNTMAAELQDNERLLVDKHRMETVGFLTAGLVHEINNPNHYITLSVSVLDDIWNKDIRSILERYVSEHGEPDTTTLSYGKIDAEVPKLLERIRGGSDRIAKIIQDLKRYSRRQAPEDPVPVDVNALIRSVVAMLDFQITKTTDHFSTELEHSIPFVMGIEHRLEQVFVNLIQNACLALTSRDDSVQVRTWVEAEGTHVVIEVHDTGEGLDEDAAAKLTTAFFTTRGDAGGVGLGLFVSNEIVKGHDGRIEFSGERGIYTTVRVFLPLADGPVDHV